jgi:hypothetical protein
LEQQCSGTYFAKIFFKSHCYSLVRNTYLSFSPGGVVSLASSLPSTEETGAIGREIECRQGIGWKFKKCYFIDKIFDIGMDCASYPGLFTG